MDTLSSTAGDRADFPRLGTRYLVRGEATFVLAGRVGIQIGDEETGRRAGCAGRATARISRSWAGSRLTMDRESIGPLSERHGLRA
jgi:hypothetical protein